MTKRSVFLFAFLLLLFVLATSGIELVPESTGPKLCEKQSLTWSGKCNDKKCDQKCISWEDAFHGACHTREGKSSCYCYFHCSKHKKKHPPKDKSPPPKDGSPPPPADGGSSPPPKDGSSPPPPKHEKSKKGHIHEDIIGRLL